MKRILVVEDDKTLGEVLNRELSKEYKTTLARTRGEALQKLKSEKFDLLILDVGLPDGNGFSIAAEIKDDPLRPHFLFLTAQSEPETRLRGFEFGAEDFIPKPFHLKEVLLRVKHVLDAHIVTQDIRLPTCVIHLHANSIRMPDGKIEFPPVKDMRILKLLIERSPSAVSRDEIINEVWGLDKELSHRTIDNAIVRLRQLIGDKDEIWLKSVRGVGYQWTYEGKL